MDNTNPNGVDRPDVTSGHETCQGTPGITQEHYEYQEGDEWDVTWFPDWNDFMIELSPTSDRFDSMGKRHLGSVIDVVPRSSLYDLFHLLGQKLAQASGTAPSTLFRSTAKKFKEAERRFPRALPDPRYHPRGDGYYWDRRQKCFVPVSDGDARGG